METILLPAKEVYPQDDVIVGRRIWTVWKVSKAPADEVAIVLRRYPSEVQLLTLRPDTPIKVIREV